MQVQIECGARALDDVHDTCATAGNIHPLGPLLVAREHGSQEGAAHRARQGWIGREQKSQAPGHRENPLPYRDVGQGVIDEMGSNCRGLAIACRTFAA